MIISIDAGKKKTQNICLYSRWRNRQGLEPAESQSGVYQLHMGFAFALLWSLSLLGAAILPVSWKASQATFYFNSSLPLARKKRTRLRQEIDGLQARHLHLASCLHFLGREKDGLQAGEHLQLASCLHFLRQEIDGLQVRYLQPASCLYFKMEITTETG